MRAICCVLCNHNVVLIVANTMCSTIIFSLYLKLVACACGVDYGTDERHEYVDEEINVLLYFVSLYGKMLIEH